MFKYSMQFKHSCVYTAGTTFKAHLEQDLFGIIKGLGLYNWIGQIRPCTAEQVNDCDSVYITYCMQRVYKPLIS